MDTNEKKVEVCDDLPSNEYNSHSGGDDGLSPSSNNNGGGCEEKIDHDVDENKEYNLYQETSYPMGDQGFVIDMICF